MKGILILNTGSPKSKHPDDVRQFIGDMLSDVELVNIINPFRHMLARWIIARRRQFESAHHYELIWDNERNMSPLVFQMQSLCREMEKAQPDTPVEYAFRYGNPSVGEALTRLEARQPNLREVVILHLFPHYARSSYQTAIDDAVRQYQKRSPQYSLRIPLPYYNHPLFISSLAERIRPFVSEPYDKLLFSYHSLPLKHIEHQKGKGDVFDYLHQTNETQRLVSEQLHLDTSKNMVVYSSAIAENWQQPFLDDTVASLPTSGHKRIVVVCAGFPADNLESLFDIDIQARQFFTEAGGEELRFVPGLNSETHWVKALCAIANDDSIAQFVHPQTQ